ncbi:glutathione transferase GTT2 [Sporobolomyces salmoneus]|uniref:glutathione transferase GTT2 n=1 Tax=Sporobolomyces salmoneus TaxID=183962 RepID=UPI00317B57CF
MSNEKLKIYTSPSAFPNPQRVRLFAYEKGIADKLDEQVLDMTPGGEQRSWRHLKVNPYGETPALKLSDGTCISESTAIARYFDNTYPGRKIMGESALEQALDQQWDQRIWVHLLYRLTVAFHVLHEGLGHKLELVKNEEWGRHCRREAIATAGMLDKHLSDGRQWILGGNEPTFADITLCTALAFSKFPTMNTDLTERFEYLENFWKRWQERDSFKQAYADGGMLDELEHLKK